MNYNQQVIQCVQKRDIVNCVHITTAKNLLSILSNGICSKAYLEDNNIEYDCADDKLINRTEDAVSISITFPNYKMFYKLRCENEKVEWVVLLLDVQQVLSLDCAFCYTNASSNEIFNIPLELRKTYEAFELMFSERKGHPYSRKDMGLRPNEPTDPQAEVLVFDNIPSSAIQEVVFKDTGFIGDRTYRPWYGLGQLLRQELDQREIRYDFECYNIHPLDIHYYDKRHDHEFWGNYK